MKFITLNLTNTNFKSFEIYSSLDVPQNKIRSVPIYYQHFFKKLEHLFIFFSYFTIIYLLIFFMLQQMHWGRQEKYVQRWIFRTWSNLTEEHSLKGNQKFCYLQTIHASPKLGKTTISSTSETINSLATREHHLIKRHQIFCLNKPTGFWFYILIQIWFLLITLNQLQKFTMRSFSMKMIFSDKIFIFYLV